MQKKKYWVQIIVVSVVILLSYFSYPFIIDYIERANPGGSNPESVSSYVSFIQDGEAVFIDDKNPEWQWITIQGVIDEYGENEDYDYFVLAYLLEDGTIGRVKVFIGSEGNFLKDILSKSIIKLDLHEEEYLQRRSENVQFITDWSEYSQNTFFITPIDEFIESYKVDTVVAVNFLAYYPEEVDCNSSPVTINRCLEYSIMDAQDANDINQFYALEEVSEDFLLFPSIINFEIIGLNE